MGVGITGVGLAGVGIVGVGITGVGIVDASHKNLDRSFFHFVTIHAFDRWSDRQTDGPTAFS